MPQRPESPGNLLKTQNLRPLYSKDTESESALQQDHQMICVYMQVLEIATVCLEMLYHGG